MSGFSVCSGDLKTKKVASRDRTLFIILETYMLLAIQGECCRLIKKKKSIVRPGQPSKMAWWYGHLLPSRTIRLELLRPTQWKERTHRHEFCAGLHVCCDTVYLPAPVSRI